MLVLLLMFVGSVVVSSAVVGSVVVGSTVVGSTVVGSTVVGSTVVSSIVGSIGLFCSCHFAVKLLAIINSSLFAVESLRDMSSLCRGRCFCCHSLSHRFAWKLKTPLFVFLPE